MMNPLAFPPPFLRPEVVAAAVAALLVGFSSGVLFPTSTSSGILGDTGAALSSDRPDVVYHYASPPVDRFADSTVITNSAEIKRILREGLVAADAGILVKLDEKRSDDEYPLGVLRVTYGHDSECGWRADGVKAINRAGVIDFEGLPRTLQYIHYPDRCMDTAKANHVLSAPLQLAKYSGPGGGYLLGNGFEGLLLKEYTGEDLGVAHPIRYRNLFDNLRQDTSGSREMLSSNNPFGDPSLEK